MILGDSLQVMASLAEREGLRGKVQCIYFDPPYGIKFNSNFQWSTTSRDEGRQADHITNRSRSRDLAHHSYLTYLRAGRWQICDRSRVQIGDERHRVAVMARFLAFILSLPDYLSARQL
jgi:adenine-specific DNA-methyltransferase